MYRVTTNRLISTTDNDVRVELEDLQTIGIESLQLQDGGYIAQPGVFHELHCLVSRPSISCNYEMLFAILP